LELFNLDELTTLERFVTLRGKRYPVVDRSVGQMIESIAMTRKGGVQTEEDFLNSMVKTVEAVIPDAPAEVIRSMSLRQMVALLEFVNTDPNKIAAEAEAQAKEEGKSGVVESVTSVSGE